VIPVWVGSVAYLGAQAIEALVCPTASRGARPRPIENRCPDCNYQDPWHLELLRWADPTPKKERDPRANRGLATQLQPHLKEQSPW
jgi:hypothetical protein